MGKNSNKNNDEQEIDLSEVSKKVGGFFRNLNLSIFQGIQFILKKIIIISILFIIGIALGIYLDDTNKSYDHTIIVRPNFGSVDYLYAKVELLNSKIKEGDTVFLKKMGIKYPKRITKIEIKPILDVYRFVDNKDRNFELLKLFAEDGDIKKIVEENVTSKNYIYHTITYTTKSLTSPERSLTPIMNFLNDDPYFKIIQKENLYNTQIKMQANEITIGQINAILDKLGNSNDGKNDRMVLNNGDSQLANVLTTKDELLQQQGYYRIVLIEGTKIIKDISNTINKRNVESVNGKMKLILPFLFVFIYILIYLFSKNYKKQKSLSKQN